MTTNGLALPEADRLAGAFAKASLIPGFGDGRGAVAHDRGFPEISIFRSNALILRDPRVGGQSAIRAGRGQSGPGLAKPAPRRHPGAYAFPAPV